MNTYEIFDHLFDTLSFVAKKGGFDTKIEPNHSIVTGYDSTVFNLVKLKGLNNLILGELKQKRIPFLCFPSRDIETKFEQIMIDNDLIKLDKVVASYFDKFSDWSYTPNPIIKCH